ncbi:Cytochrome P450 3A40 [Geodia barretti]|uniref:Cytochrome P450 3A40 n=1 Tax=Geodia barretti TaxID=519541 RepID=A0AA35RDD7_GEOBA|nr:Cytochrome P450 3A40 [Geodia barretti]
MAYYLWLVILLLLLLYTYYKWGYEPFQVFKRMGIPGPPPAPFLGNLVTLITRKDGMDVIAEWNQTYGDVCGG